MRLQRAFTAYIALSSQGHPAFFLGYAPTAKQLREHYAAKFPAEDDRHGLRAFGKAGYRSVKVTISEAL